MSKPKMGTNNSSAQEMTRRGLLVGAASAGSLAFDWRGTLAAQSVEGEFEEDSIDLTQRVPFYGTGEQAGISTPMQRHCVYMTFDLTTSSRTDLQVLLARWSAAIAQLTAGEAIGQIEPHRVTAIGGDTGESLDLAPASLTVTVGLGPNVFSDTFGTSEHRPPLLRELASLPSDRIVPDLSGGDLSLQACADDPQVAYHAVRNLARVAKITGAAITRWTVLGFGRASAGKGQVTPRNLMGYKDGTRNITEPEDFDDFVWISDGPEWQHKGTYQVARKIQMNIENWDVDPVSDQNLIFGRFKMSGAPLTGEDEFDTPDFEQVDENGDPVIDSLSHIKLASFEHNNGIKILRRGYNYTDGINQYGFLDAGLLFISYQNDPANFEILQRKLGASDLLNEYIAHIGSAMFFVPPAPQEGRYIAQAMFE
ncbi:MAG: Dyp-type peroxidase [Thermomicrobiales bacterium]|nr:Dyp-type peroxidase [Thermomicrobiales bacterium]